MEVSPLVSYAGEHLDEMNLEDRHFPEAYNLDLQVCGCGCGYWPVFVDVFGCGFGCVTVGVQVKVGWGCRCRCRCRCMCLCICGWVGGWGCVCERDSIHNSGSFQPSVFVCVCVRCLYR